MTLVPADAGSYRHTDDPGEPTTGQPRLSVTDEEAAVLSAVCIGRGVLEIGTGLGVSTRALADSARFVITVDVDPWVHDNVWPFLPGNVAGVKALDEITASFDAVFIDGDHSTDATRRDIDFARSHLLPGGLLVVHDVNYGSVRKALTGPGWRTVTTSHGLGFWREAWT